MCSRESDSELQKDLETNRGFKIQGTKCMKCANQAICIARVKDPFCRDCFLSYFMHRFRSTVGKAKTFKHEEKVLLGYSGGPSSTAMLKVVQEGLLDQTHKKLRFTPSVVILDEGIVHGHTQEECVQFLAQRITVALNMGYCVYFTYLEELFGRQRVWKAGDILPLEGDGFGSLSGVTSSAKDVPPPKTDPSIVVLPQIIPTDSITVEGSNPTSNNDLVPEDGERDESNPLAVCFADEDCVPSDPPKTKKHPPAVDQQPKTVLPLMKISVKDVVSALKTVHPDKTAGVKLKDLFSNLSSLTAKEDMLRTIRHQFLCKVAKENGFTKVLTGDNETVLAVHLLSCVAQGRGGTIPMETGFVDDRHHGTTIVRPMREFPSAEIAVYCNMQRLELVIYPVLGSMAPKDASIEKMTEDFVTSLLVNFPNTVNTVFRTGDKISMGRKLSTAEICCLCGCPLGSSTSRGIAQDMKKSILPSSLQAVEKVESVNHSTTSRDNTSMSTCGCQEDGCGEGSCSQKSPKRLTMKDFEDFLCYGCQLTLRDVKESASLEELLPHYVVSEVDRRQQRLAMKEQIKEFLIADDCSED